MIATWLTLLFLLTALLAAPLLLVVRSGPLQVLLIVAVLAAGLLGWLRALRRLSEIFDG